MAQSCAKFMRLGSAVGAKRARSITTAAGQQADVNSNSAPVGVVMLNMGGPSSLEGVVDGVEPFLNRLFCDKEIIRLGPLQKWLGPYIANKRSPRIREQYAKIGGKSPILDWTRHQGQALERALNRPAAVSAKAGSSAPAAIQPATPQSFKHYIAFRYAPPLTEEALLSMAADGVTRAVAFTQYPHFSCTTTGSSLNHLWRETVRLGLEKRFQWSIIDRWPTHPTYVRAVARCVATGLSRFPVAVRDNVVIVFTAHSIPMMIVNRGDPYVQEIGATVSAVMDLLRRGDSGIAPCTDASGTDQTQPDGPSLGPVASPYVLAWQSKVGFLPWMGPPTGEVLKGLGRQGHKYVLTVPIAFTSDHIETLFEIDHEYREDAAKAGIVQFERAPSLNGEPLLTTAQADIVRSHLASGATASPQYPLNCAGCTNPSCRSVLNPVQPYAKLRDSYAPGGCVTVPGSPWPTDGEVARLKALGTTPNP